MHFLGASLFHPHLRNLLHSSLLHHLSASQTAYSPYTPVSVLPRKHETYCFSTLVGLNKVSPAFIPGAFNQALTTDVRQIEQSDDTTSLGRLTVRA